MHVLVLLLLYMYVNWEDFGASEYMLSQSIGFWIIFFLWTKWTQSFFWLFVWALCIDILIDAENCCPCTNIIYLINWFCLNSYSMSNCNFCNKHSVVKRALMYILCLFQIQLSTSSGTHLIYILGTAIYEITLIH